MVELLKSHHLAPFLVLRSFDPLDVGLSSFALRTVSRLGCATGVNAAELVASRFALEGWLKSQLQTHTDNTFKVPRIDRAHIVKYDAE